VGYIVEHYPHSYEGADMKTIQMTIDDELLAEVDQATHALQTTRSAFIRSALQLALRQYAIQQLEQQHADGYARFPVQPGEFDIWESEQSWSEA
jgi:metal-responsive CopG/Arc/MetJ family transcriptional regulator